jgi:hypothetical protein
MCLAARDVPPAQANGVNISEGQCGYVARDLNVPLMQALLEQMQSLFLERVSVLNSCHFSKPEDQRE